MVAIEAPPASPASSPRQALVDRFGRTITHLRMSVTSACDLRCVYCRPGAVQADCSAGTLSDAQRVELAGFLHARHALEQIRLTGGEPLVYEPLTSLVERLRAAAPALRLAMTTNGRLLGRAARGLRAAGLDRLNVSLDSLRASRYQEITGGRLADVLAGLDEAESAGFPPPRLNAVVLRGVNDDEMTELADWAMRRGRELRLLEAMPIGPAAAFNRAHFVPAREILATLAGSFTLKPLPRPEGDTSETFLAEASGVRGTIGIIAPVSRPFCTGCRRMRLTADGRLFPCLLEDRSVGIAGAWQRGAFDADAAASLIREAVNAKPATGSSQRVRMVVLGG